MTRLVSCRVIPAVQEESEVEYGGYPPQDADEVWPTELACVPGTGGRIDGLVTARRARRLPFVPYLAEKGLPEGLVVDFVA